MVGHILKVLTDVQKVLEIPIKSKTTHAPVAKQQTREMVETEEYDNPEGPDAKYWNSNWIVGSCACLFC